MKFSVRSIQDNDVRIPEDKQSLLFDRFYQSSESTTRRYGGTGLGRSVWIRSKSGKRSTFHFTIKPGDLE